MNKVWRRRATGESVSSIDSVKFCIAIGWTKSSYPLSTSKIDFVVGDYFLRYAISTGLPVATIAANLITYCSKPNFTNARCWVNGVGTVRLLGGSI